MGPIILGSLLLAYGTVAIIVGVRAAVFGSDDPGL